MQAYFANYCFENYLIITKVTCLMMNNDVMTVCGYKCIIFLTEALLMNVPLKQQLAFISHVNFLHFYTNLCFISCNERSMRQLFLHHPLQNLHKCTYIERADPVSNNTKQFS